MYFWIAFPLLRITLLFTTGILLAIVFPAFASRESIILGLVAVFIIYFLIWRGYQRTRFYSLNLLFGILGHLLIALSGYAVLLFHDDRYAFDHLLYKSEVQAYKVQIIDEVHSGEKSTRVLGKLLATKDTTSWQPATGKFFIYIRKGATVRKVTYGDVLLIQGSPEPTRLPKNPGEFNYRQYLSYRNIYHQDFIGSDAFVIVERHPGFWLYSSALISRQFLKEILYRYVVGDRERAIALALLLGTKDALTPEINAAYSSAGAMHILAVSGLHVGIIYGLILFFFAKYQKGKIVKWFFLLVTLGALWSYALITGLSASVLRAVAMFSLVAIARVAKRESNIYNTLSAAGLILLCYDPYMVMFVGFQLSFLAVFGIVYITPKIYHLILVDLYFLDKMWEMISVCVAAQIATAPLVLLYFHQFPTYFFIANLVVIPAAFAILVLGILLFVFEMVSYVSDALGFVLEQLLFWTNEFVFAINRLPYNTVDNLYINTAQAWLIIAGIILLFSYLHYKKLYQFVALSLVIAAFFAFQESRTISNLQKKEIVFYSISQHTAIDFLQAGQAILVADSILLGKASKVNFHIQPKRLRAGANTSILPSTDNLVRNRIGENELIVWNGQTILIFRKYSPQIKDIEVDVLVIANNSIFDLEQLASIDVGAIIIDGSNSRYRTNKLMQQAQANHLKAIDLLKNGAYTIPL